MEDAASILNQIAFDLVGLGYFELVRNIYLI